MRVLIYLILFVSGLLFFNRTTYCQVLKQNQSEKININLNKSLKLPSRIKIQKQLDYINISNAFIYQTLSDTYVVIGILENVGRKPSKQIILQYTFYDKNDNIVDKKYDKHYYDFPPLILSPNEKAPFLFEFSNDTVHSSWKVSYVVSQVLLFRNQSISL